MKGKSSRISFNVSSSKKALSKLPRLYSYKQLAHKIDLYAKHTKTKNQSRDLNKIKTAAFEAKSTNDKRRAVQGLHLQQGIDRGINTPSQQQNFEATNRAFDRKEIQKRAVQAKALYRHYGFSHDFNKKSKSKGLDKG